MIIYSNKYNNDHNIILSKQSGNRWIVEHKDMGNTISAQSENSKLKAVESAKMLMDIY